MTASHSLALRIDEFAEVVRLTPLVSIDLIITDRSGRVLVGLRRNPPAQDTWFVPGGRIRKDETLAAAWDRIIQSEIGLSSTFDSSLLAGVFEHHYGDNFLGNVDFTTHYVVLAYRVVLEEFPEIQNDEQHDRLSWLEIEELLAHPGVHENTKAYFRRSV